MTNIIVFPPRPQLIIEHLCCRGVDEPPEAARWWFFVHYEDVDGGLAWGVWDGRTREAALEVVADWRRGEPTPFDDPIDFGLLETRS